MGNSTKKFAIFFLLSVLIGYSQSIAPYYIQKFSTGKLKIIGDLDRFKEPCGLGSNESKKCDYIYKIPSKLLTGFPANSSIGLGVFIHFIDISCGRNLISFGDPDSTGRIFESLNTYITFPLAQLSCSEDLIITTWKPINASRSGHTSGIAVIGEDSWVRRVKNLIEWFNGPVLLLMATILAGLLSTERLLYKITGREFVLPNFDPFVSYWILFVLIMSGFFFDLLLPIDLPFLIVPRLQVFLGALGLIGPLLFYVFKNKFNKSINLHIRSLNICPRLDVKFLALFIVAAAISFSQNFANVFKVFLFATSIIGIFLSTKNRNTLFFLFSISILIDTLKLSMIPFLPMSRVSVFYSFFIFLNFIIEKFYILYRETSDDHAYSLALQVAHDIRAPLGALRVLTDSVDKNTEALDLYKSALGRLEDISKKLLNASPILSIDQKSNKIEIISIINNVVKEKKALKHPDTKILSRSNVEIFHYKIDRTELQAVVSNAIDNALFLNPPPEHVSVIVRRRKKSLDIEIEDDGHGIPEDLLKILNDKSHLNVTPSITGFGLGHSYSKKVIQRIGGSVTMVSILGVGTKIKISFPI